MIVNGNDKLILNALESLYVNNLTLSGSYAIRNGKRDNAKVLFDSADVVIKNGDISGTIYNAIEQAGTSAKYPVKSFKASNIKAVDTNIKHNIFNIYKFADNANVEISDCEFSLDVANSNIMRLANIGNASNVTITFKNVKWTYEEKTHSTEDAAWAGLVLFQPWPIATDGAWKSADLSSIKTWNFVFDNCSYNGEKITKNVFGDIKQVVYGYTLDEEGKSINDINDILNIQFK